MPPSVTTQQTAMGADAGSRQYTSDTIEPENAEENDLIVPEEIITTNPWGRVIVAPWREGDDGARGDKYEIKATYRRATILNDDEETSGEAQLYAEAERGLDGEEAGEEHEEETPLTEEQREQQKIEDAMQITTEAEERAKDYADPFSGEHNPASKMADSALAKDPVEEISALNAIREVLRRQYAEEPPAPTPDRGPAPAEGLARCDSVSPRILAQQWPMKPIHIPNATIRSPISPMDATQEEFDATSLSPRRGNKRRANAQPEGGHSPKSKSTRRQPDTPLLVTQKHMYFEDKVLVSMRGGSGGDDSSAGSGKKKDASIFKAMQKLQKQAEKYKATQKGKNKRPSNEEDGDAAEEPDPKTRKVRDAVTTVQEAQKAAAVAERKKKEKDAEKVATGTENKKGRDATVQQKEQRRQEHSKRETELRDMPKEYLKSLLIGIGGTVDPTWLKGKIITELLKLEGQAKGTKRAGGNASRIAASKDAVAGAKGPATTGSKDPVTGDKRRATEPPAGPAPDPKRPATDTATGPTATLPRRRPETILEGLIDPNLIALAEARREQDPAAAKQMLAAAALDAAQGRAQHWAQFPATERQRWLERWNSLMSHANIDSSPAALSLPEQSRPRLPRPWLTEFDEQEVQRQSGVYFYLQMVNRPDVAGTDKDGRRFVEAGTCKVYDGFFGPPAYEDGGVLAQARPWRERATEGFEEMLRAAREDQSGRAYISDGYATRNGRPRGVLLGDLPKNSRYEELGDVSSADGDSEDDLWDDW